MKKTSLFLIAFFALSVLILSACASGGASASLGGEWTLISYGDPSNLTPALPGVETSITFENDQVGGTVGCNNFGGEYNARSDQITFGSMASTLMFCEGTSEQEGVVLGILSDKTMSFTLSGDQLTLSSADGAAVVILKKK
ncbi:MAG: META domain-containing protein [Chloroflexi bacterium]|nr:META domain-containing protein [Chloroflexota bacterium]